MQYLMHSRIRQSERLSQLRYGLTLGIAALDLSIAFDFFGRFVGLGDIGRGLPNV